MGETQGDNVDRAFRACPRANFLPRIEREYAVRDAPVPIGFGQTNSQPATVRNMLGWLEVEEGDKVLDVGSGSGWTTALLSFLVGPRGFVYAVEKIPELVAFGRENCRRLGTRNVRFFLASKTFGLPKHAPFDRILVSASAEELPVALIEQLKEDGKIVIPVGTTVLDITKGAHGQLDIIPHGGYLFVPLLN